MRFDFWRSLTLTAMFSLQMSDAIKIEEVHENGASLAELDSQNAIGKLGLDQSGLEVELAQTRVEALTSIKKSSSDNKNDKDDKNQNKLASALGPAVNKAIAKNAKPQLPPPSKSNSSKSNKTKQTKKTRSPTPPRRPSPPRRREKSPGRVAQEQQIVNENEKLDEYKKLYEDKNKAYIELQVNYKTLQKKFEKLSKVDQKVQVVDLLNEVQKRGGLYKKMEFTCPNDMKKTVDAKVEAQKVEHPKPAPAP